MTWLLLLTPRGPAVEFSRWASPADRVISAHETKPEADEALRLYREREEREALRAAGQKDLFPEGV